jgi:hypothetical protein
MMCADAVGRADPGGGKKSRSHLTLAAPLLAVVALAQRVLCRCGSVLAHCGATEERAVVVVTALVTVAYATVGVRDRLELRLKSPEPQTTEAAGEAFAECSQTRAV